MKIRLAALAVLAAVSFAGCGDSKPAGGASVGATSAPPPAASPFATAKVAHILIAKDGRGRRTPKITRTKADAYTLAKSLLADIKGGRDFLEVASKFSEDVGPDNKLNTNCGEPGVYFGAAIEGFDPAWKDAALKTPVGSVAAEPVESESYGYFLIKRIQ